MNELPLLWEFFCAHLMGTNIRKLWRVRVKTDKMDIVYLEL